MTESERMQIKGALRKCAKENEGKTTYTGHVVISSVCNAAAERIEELEAQIEKMKNCDNCQHCGCGSCDEAGNCICDDCNEETLSEWECIL